MEIQYKGTKLKDTKSRKYKVFKAIDKQYGCLSHFLEDIELKIIKK